MGIATNKLPTVAETIDNGNNNDWSNLTNQYSLNGATSEILIPKGAVGDKLYTHGYDFSEIPSGSTIDGIEVTLHSNNNASYGFDSTAYVVIGGVESGSNYATGETFASGASTRVYGGATDLFGNTSIDLSQIQSSDFGFMFSAESQVGNNDYFDIDAIEISIFYTSSFTYQTVTVQSDFDFTQEMGDNFHATTDWQYPSNNDVITDGDPASYQWQNISNAYSDTNDSEAEHYLAQSKTNIHTLILKDFGFLYLPSDARIIGITIEYATRIGYQDIFHEDEVYLTLNGTNVSENFATSTNLTENNGNYIIRTLGGIDDKLGLTLSPDDFKNSEFGFRIKSHKSSDNFASYGIGYVRIKVEYGNDLGYKIVDQRFDFDFTSTVETTYLQSTVQAVFDFSYEVYFRFAFYFLNTIEFNQSIFDFKYSTENDTITIFDFMSSFWHGYYNVLEIDSNGTFYFKNKVQDASVAKNLEPFYFKSRLDFDYFNIYDESNSIKSVEPIAYFRYTNDGIDSIGGKTSVFNGNVEIRKDIYEYPSLYIDNSDKFQPKGNFVDIDKVDISGDFTVSFWYSNWDINGQTPYKYGSSYCGVLRTDTDKSIFELYNDNFRIFEDYLIPYKYINVKEENHYILTRTANTVKLFINGILFDERQSSLYSTFSIKYICKDLNSTYSSISTFSNLYISDKFASSSVAKDLFLNDRVTIFRPNIVYSFKDRQYFKIEVVSFNFTNSMETDSNQYNKITMKYGFHLVNLCSPDYSKVITMSRFTFRNNFIENTLNRVIGNSDVFKDDSCLHHFKLVNGDFNDSANSSYKVDMVDIHDFMTAHQAGKRHELGSQTGLFGSVYTGYLGKIKNTAMTIGDGGKSLSFWLNVNENYNYDNAFYDYGLFDPREALISIVPEEYATSGTSESISLYRTGDKVALVFGTYYTSIGRWVLPYDYTILFNVDKTKVNGKYNHVVINMKQNGVWETYLNGEISSSLNMYPHNKPVEMIGESIFKIKDRSSTFIGGRVEAEGSLGFYAGTRSKIENIRQFNKALTEYEIGMLYGEGLGIVFSQKIQPLKIERFYFSCSIEHGVYEKALKLIKEFDIYGDGSTDKYVSFDEVAYDESIVPYPKNIGYAYGSIPQTNFHYRRGFLPLDSDLVTDIDVHGYIYPSGTVSGYFATGYGINNEDFSLLWSSSDNDRFGLSISDKYGGNNTSSNFKYDYDYKIFKSYDSSYVEGVSWDNVEIPNNVINYYAITQKRLNNGKYVCSLYVNDNEHITLSNNPIFPKVIEGSSLVRKPQHGIYVSVIDKYSCGAIRLLNKVITKEQVLDFINEGMFETNLEIKNTLEPYNIVHYDDFFVQHIDPSYWQNSSKDDLDVFGDGSGEYLWRFDGNYLEESGRGVISSMSNLTYSTVHYDQGVFDNALRLDSNEGISFSTEDIESNYISVSFNTKLHNDAGYGSFRCNILNTISLYFITNNNDLKMDIGSYPLGVSTNISITDMKNVYNHLTFVIYKGNNYNSHDGWVKVYFNDQLTITITDLSIYSYFKNLLAFGSSTFNGNVDQLRVFNRELRPSEILSLIDEKIAPASLVFENFVEPYTIQYYDIINNIEKYKAIRIDVTYEIGYVLYFFKFKLVSKLQQSYKTLFIRRT